ncbi:MAG: copper-binding protein [Acidobacteriota bacterium]|nr:copper-binding protein [Acidobacteriota bacterium]
MRRRMSRLVTGLALVTLVAVAGGACKARDQLTVRSYAMQGKVLAVDVQGKQATIQHGDIPGFMGAMTMAYPIKDDEALARLKKGDEIKAVVVVDDTKGLWLEHIQILPPAPSAAPAK